jgi:hypothetical protein
MTSFATRGSAEGWFTPRRFGAVLALMVLASFPEVALGLKTFVHRDFGLFGYPLAFYHRECFWRGELPLWNPYNNGGLPFLAQWNTMVLYPGSLIYLLLPLPWSLNLFCLVHLFWAGLGMYWLTLRWTGHRLAAAIAGVAFAFNGLTLNALMWPNNIAALGWMPWVVWLVEKGWREGKQHVLLAAAVGALQMLTGAPEIVIFTWLLLGGMWAGQWWKRTRPRALLFRRAAAVVLMVVGLSAAQMFPFLDLLWHSHRDAGFSTGAWSMPPWGWANFLVPLFRVNRSGSGLMYQPEQYWTSSYYVSIGVVALALWAVAGLRQPRTFFLTIALVGSLMLALGDAGKIYRWLREGFPIANFMRFPIKFVVVAAFVLPILAGFAVRERTEDIDRNAGKYRPSALAVWLMVVSAVMAVLAWAFFRPLHATDWSVTCKSGIVRLLFLSLIMVTLRAALRGHVQSQPWLLACGIVVLIWLDVLTHAPWQNPATKNAVFAPGLLTAQQLGSKPLLGHSRAMLTLAAMDEFYRKNLPDPAENLTMRRIGLHNDLNLLEGIPKVDGFFSLYLPEERALHFRLYASDREVRPGFADLLGVTHVTAPTNALAWAIRPTAMPLLTLGQRPIFAERDQTLTNLIGHGFNPRKVVFLPRSATMSVSAGNEPGGDVRSFEWSPHHIKAEVEAKSSTVLVVSQMHYHPWKAAVDGVASKVWPANLALQAVAVPAGRHTVELVYKDHWFNAGLVVTGLSAAGLLIGWRREQRLKT